MDNSLELGLYIVATPIGNLSDITLRAIDILKKVDTIAAEDTRNTSVLLDKYNITTKLISYHKYSEASKAELIIKYLDENKPIALVSDAGTPLISDPGGILVQKVTQKGYKVFPIPGPSAVITLLSSTNRQDEDFKFIGFLPKNNNQIVEMFEKNKNENIVFYESPNRIKETLELIKKQFPEKNLTIGRELTKKFEEIKTGSIIDIINYYNTNPLKGEIVCLLHKSKDIENKNFDLEIKKLKSLGYKNKDIAVILSTLFEANKNEIYKTCLDFE